MKNKTEHILWSEMKDKLSKIHPTLTKSDLIWRNGTITDMLEMISSKLGVTVKELKDEIDNF